MDLLKFFCILLLSQIISGCSIGFYIKGAYHQTSMFFSRTSVDKVLADPNLSEDNKKKIILTQKARHFSQEVLHLKETKNYTQFVQLDRPYLTYVVSASPKWELKHHLWWYPFVGDLPYRGYFVETDAKDLEEDLKKDDLDTYRRGVSAYSSLGWISDPLYSSMLRYRDYELVNTIIHETVHATLYIKNSADFNERMAVFLGNKGTEIFYTQEEGPQSETLARVKKDNEDDKVFSQFISAEIKNLEAWYKEQKDKNEETRQKRIKDIQAKFKADVLPKMKSKSYERFLEVELNNARLLNYKTYMQDLSDFEKLFQSVNGDFSLFLEKCKSLEKSEKPEEDLKKLVL